MQNLNLRMLESKTWRANQQDGLFDLFLGVLFLGIAFAQVADGLWDSEAASLGVLVCVQFGGAAGLWLARRRVTRPRVGVRFALPRKRRMRATRVFLALCVAMTLALVLLTALGGRFGNLWAGPVSRYTVSATAAGLVFLVFSGLALFLEFPRLLIHGALFAGAEFAGTWLEELGVVAYPRAIVFGVAAVVSAAIGVVLLVRFLRTAPADPTESEPGGPDHA